jgi:TRAP transporter TAXI family solute receptor
VKNFFYCLLALALIASLGLSACAKQGPEEIVIGAPGGETGPSYPILSGIGLMLEEHLGVSVSITATSGDDATVLMNRGDLQIAMPSTQSAERILHGAEGVAPCAMRAWLQAQIFEISTITLEGSGIESFADLSGKTICIGPRGSPVASMLFQAIADAYGFNYEDLKIVEWSIPTEAFDGLKTGKYDAINVGTSYPDAATTELCLSYPARILGVDDAHMAQLIEKLPWLISQTIPGGTYEGIDEDIETPAIAMFVTTYRDLPDSFVYEMTKMIWENFAEFASFHPMAAKFKAEDVAKIVPIMPYHPGAIKYYKEIGVWTAELDEIQANLLATLPEEVR